MSDILFADGKRYSREWLENHEDQAQRILRAHKNTYPKCLCRSDGIPMHIRELSLTHTLYLARMPGTGPRHHVDCPSYEPVHGPAEKEAVEQGLIDELADGRIVFKLDVGFGIRDNAAEPPPARQPAEYPQMVGTTPMRLGLLAMIQFLWEQAELHHWHPRMQGRRRYKQVYERLLSAAGRIWVKGFALDHRLYIPEPFHKDRATEISVRRLETLSRLGRGASGKRRRFLVLAQIRGYKQNADVVRLRMAHVGDDMSIQLPKSTWERLCRRWGVAVPDEDSDMHLWGLFLIDAFQNHVLLSRAAALMQTTAQYIPVFGGSETALAYGLVDSERRFIKMLAFDGRPTGNGPAFVLTDVTDEPYPLYITGEGMPETGSTDEWYWHTDREDIWPPLPAPKTIRRTIN